MEKNYIIWNLITCTPHPILFGNQIEDEMGGACSTSGEMRDLYKVLVGKRKGKRPLGRPRPRWENNIKINL
jgi:hypothetical protein